MLRAWQNQILFPLRQMAVRLRFNGYSEEFTGEPIVQDLVSADLARRLKEQSLLDALYYGELLEQTNWKSSGTGLPALDIGSKNFYYAAALYSYLQRRGGPRQLTGIEVDGGRRYIDYYRRKDYADYYVSCVNQAKSSEGAKVEYFEADWLTWRPDQEYELITCFFPFLFTDLSDNWGLPRKFFNPKQFYSKMLNQAQSIILFHQGEEEFQFSQDLLRELGLKKFQQAMKCAPSKWVEQRHEIFCIHASTTH